VTVIAGSENEAEVVTPLWQSFLALVKHHHRPWVCHFALWQFFSHFLQLKRLSGYVLLLCANDTPPCSMP
jgi:hypothetical protein